MKSFTIQGNFVDIQNQRIYAAVVQVENGKIAAVQEINNSTFQPLTYILPGFIDAHVHIESSMLIPSEFARLAVVHGTVATVSDPHEIANVCGVAGVEFMIRDGNTVPFKFYFGAPSCVPATHFETAGAAINSADIGALLDRNDIKYLTEMMNFPGVLNGDDEVMKKIAAAKRLGKPVDGHAPGLKGEEAKKYIDAGISTDHECFTAAEALDKLEHGMKIIIREGSAAKNFDVLVHLINDYPDKIMFCSDDKHPDSLVEGHINELCKRAVAKGVDVFYVLKAACVNPVLHYGLNVGLLREGDSADFIVVKDLENFEVLQTYINGILVAEKGKSLIRSPFTVDSLQAPINNFNCTKKNAEDFEVLFSTHHSPLTVIEALDGQLITNKVFVEPKVVDGKVVSDIVNDILKIVVVNRYFDAPVAKAFIKNFGLKRGAIASSVAHDSHNIIAVGVDDESICKAVNLIIEKKGGISLTPGPSQASSALRAPSPKEKGNGKMFIGEGNSQQPSTVNANVIDNESFNSGESSNSENSFKESLGRVLPLPVAGLMSAEDGYKVAEYYAAMDRQAKELGSTLSAPFMTLSFMALLVIPHLKLSDKGLFDGDGFKLID